MTLVDRTLLRTPEGVVYGLPLAGLGSRFIAGSIDIVVQIIIISTIAQISDGGLGTTFSVIGVFVILFGYQFVGEGFFNGRTPGKRMAGIRVVSQQGGPVSVSQAAVRNLVRIADFLPMFYVVGILGVLTTPRGQRIGDIAAGTYVVVEPSKRKKKQVSTTPTARPTVVLTDSARQELATWDVVAITRNDIGIVRQFLARRDSLDPATRIRIADAYAAKLRPRVHGVHPTIASERFLELLVEAKQSRR
jgi:uncharacterized RDD family membrane protein YckC